MLSALVEARDAAMELPPANFMDAVTRVSDAERELADGPARSFITWQSSSPAFPHGVILTYSNTVNRKSKTHVRLARSDLGVWMPESRSENRVFPSVRDLLSTRKYLDLKYRHKGASNDVPSVPGETGCSTQSIRLVAARAGIALGLRRRAGPSASLKKVWPPRLARMRPFRVSRSR